MNNLIQKIKEEARGMQIKLMEWRTHLHQHPELSFQEVNTSQFLQKVLEEHGISFETGWAGNGLVGLLSGHGKGNRVIALRADMDALPIQEENECSYKSMYEGVMHACGHDVHMTWLLGALVILSKFKAEWGGVVKFLFQPGEEKLPGGASLMIQQGVLENPKVSLIIGQHVQPGMQVGKMGVSGGNFMASCDELYVEIIGKGGHAATPHLCVDVVLAASQVVIALQSLISREKNPMHPAVLSFGKFNTMGGATNIIPERVRLEGTFRCMDEDTRERLLSRIQQMTEIVAHSLNAEARVQIDRGYPCLKNDEQAVQHLTHFAKDYLGEGQVEQMVPRMTSEDFAYYSHQVPAVFYRTGIGKAESVHHPRFDVDEDCLHTGAGCMAFLAMSHLRG